MRGKGLEPKLYSQAPSECTKPGCEGAVIVRHQDGWQCSNCMEIFYKYYESMKTKGGSSVMVITFNNLGE